MEQGIDAYFMEEGFFDLVDDAKVNPVDVIYMDLSLQSSKLKAIPPEVYACSNLKYLELGLNQVASIDAAIFSLVSLQVLGLSSNKYLTKVSEKISSLTPMKELHVKNTGLSGAQINAMKLPEGCELIK